ncbi:MAG: hypothetical protein NW218_22395 [Saprospiraceae bacterium]|nr:hypothetical protein [Saprospiraceae bacterium]
MHKFQIKILLITIVFILNCKHTSENILMPTGSSCKLWWLYDEAISDGPTHIFICFNKYKYNCLKIYKSGSLKNTERVNDQFFSGDVVYPLTDHGKWEVRHDSLILQGENFSAIKRVSDTIFLRPDAFLLDQTEKFNIANCNCDSLVAQFKGGNIDSVRTILNYKVKRE